MSTKTTRTFVVGDECPDDLYHVVDGDGDPWFRGESPTAEPSCMWHCGIYGVTWTWEHLLTSYEPLTEHRAAHAPRRTDVYGIAVIGVLAGWAAWLVARHGLHMPELSAGPVGALVVVLVVVAYARKGDGS